MDKTKEEIIDFLNKCEQLKKSKFILATSHITDILRSIVNSAALYELFSVVTADFDYISAKRKHLITQYEGVLAGSYLVLPDTIGDRLAFIFCLLVEFNHNTINFNDFLRQFFAEDGSYYSSFHKFCDKVISSLQNIIIEIFSDELIEEEKQVQIAPAPPAPEAQHQSTPPLQTYQLRPRQEQVVQPQYAQTESSTDSGLAMNTFPVDDKKEVNVDFDNLESTADPDKAERYSVVSILIAREKSDIGSSYMSEEDKQEGIFILNELENAFRENRYRSVDGMLNMYSSYSMRHGNFSNLVNKFNEAMEDK